MSNKKEDIREEQQDQPVKDQIEDAIDEHPAVAESAVVGFPHEVKGNALYAFVILKEVG